MCFEVIYDIGRSKKLVIEKKLIPKITTILEYEDFWVFEYPEDIEIDDCPSA